MAFFAFFLFVHRRLRQAEQPAGQPAGRQRQHVRNARDEPTGAAQNAGAELVDGVQLEFGRARVGENDAGRERGTGVGVGPLRRRRRRRSRTKSNQRVRGVPVGRHRTRRFRDRVQKTHGRVEAQHVLQERAVMAGIRDEIEIVMINDVYNIL